MRIDKKYTTDEKSSKDIEGEKDKTVISNDAYAIVEALEILTNIVRSIR